MDWITDKIAIGNFRDAREFESEVDAILCLIPNCCDEENAAVDTLSIPLRDANGNRKQDAQLAIEFISGVVASGDRILVHCQAGRSRSVCIVAAYFVVHNNMSVNEALSFIQSKRDIYLSDGILEIFELCRA
ncbi:MAG: dual specificity protein phosphatase family protein [Desulfamplus sp.]|nr:dual specificity protein phosphatase family protein [Desulfamplus sp.]